mgnify:CR=1 FL=1|tara:strand:+ start:35465 stop:36016 length:552 start_codon:yes stop_codon:yes gene_type:complete
MRKINPDLIKFLRESGFHVGDSICYLVSLYLGYEVSYVPEGLKQKLHILNIVKFDKTLKSLDWKISLFENLDMGLDWVKDEYLILFEPFQKHNKYKRECVNRMQALLLEFPELHKDLILEATQLYIMSCQQERRQAKFVSNPHYFIQKGKGTDKTNPILTFVDLAKDRKFINKERVSKSITMK